MSGDDAEQSTENTRKQVMGTELNSVPFLLSAPQVIGLGQCSLDILGQTDVYPELDQKAELDDLLVQGGGPVATALVTLARLGVAVAMVGAVGDDDYGRQIRAGLCDEQVDCSHLREISGESSQVAFIVVDAAGHRNIFWHRGSAFPQWSKQAEALLATDCARILHLDGLHLDAAIPAAQAARQRGVVTVLDAGTFRPGIEELLPLIDHLVVSERFAYAATGAATLEAALPRLRDYAGAEVTVTMGRAGSVSLDGTGQVLKTPAFAVEAVDTTGCGDVFHGSYIYGLLQGWALPRILPFASACAALKTRALGGRTAIPGLDEVEGLLREG
ncbi:MAG: PfkB family carbohydrate kinase [Desulfuromonadales bacterium]|nr:PfkB family carbohydrate kinase [Desulfuromonadales bacterium]